MANKQEARGGGKLYGIMRAKGQLTIPAEIRKAAHLEENAPVVFELTERGVLLRPGKVVDAGQAWFWTPEWQAGEREADADLAAGRFARHESDEAFLASLEARCQLHADA